MAYWEAIVLLSWHAKYDTSGVPHSVKPRGVLLFFQSPLVQSILEQFQKFFFVMLPNLDTHIFCIIKYLIGLTSSLLETKNWFL